MTLTMNTHAAFVNVCQCTADEIGHWIREIIYLK